MKCVTSPNDFATDNFMGIPDDYDGRTITKRHTSVNTMPTPNSADDFYIVFAPTPGVAYWYGSRTTGSTGTLALTPVYYSDFTTLFPSGSEGSVVNAFRYASNVLEIVPTVNSMNWGGAIEVWKANLIGNAGAYPTTTTVQFVINGMESINAVKPQSVLPFNHGMYSVTACCNAENMFQNILGATPPASIASDVSSWGGANNFIGIGCQETVIVKMPYATASNSALIRTWACIEYTLTPTSLLYDYSHLSPPCDPVALQLVRQFIQSQPVAVAYYDNDSFWRRFTTWIRDVSGKLKVIPGITGEVAGITNLVSKTALNYLT